MTDEFKPTLDMSQTPGNSYMFWCDSKEQRRSYYSCLGISSWCQDRIDKGEEMSVEADWRNDCGAAVKCGRCPVVAMREEEIEKGEPIYFVRNMGTASRPSPQKKEKRAMKLTEVDSRESYQRGWEKAGEPATTSTAAKPKRKSAFSSMFQGKNDKPLKPAVSVPTGKTGTRKPAPEKVAPAEAHDVMQMDLGKVVTDMAAEERTTKKETAKKPSLLDIARSRKKEVEG